MVYLLAKDNVLMMRLELELTINETCAEKELESKGFRLSITKTEYRECKFSNRGKEIN